MIKKSVIVLVVALMFGVSVLGMVNAVYAAELLSQPDEGAFEYQWGYQYGTQGGGFEPFRVAARTQTQTQLLPDDADCSGEPDPQLIRLNRRFNQNYARRQQRFEQIKLNQGANNSPQLLGNGLGQ